MRGKGIRQPALERCSDAVIFQQHARSLKLCKRGEQVFDQGQRPLLSSFSHTHTPSISLQRGWQINPTTQTVHFTNKADMATKDAIPKKATITSNLQFAKELESIV
jgi:hypothetical protein